MASAWATNTWQADDWANYPNAWTEGGRGTQALQVTVKVVVGGGGG